MDRKQKILIVDDVSENINLLITLLKDQYTLIAAKNGIRALQLANKDTKPDLILLDIMMPLMDGFEVCEKLKANSYTKDIPVIFITSKSDDESIQKGYEIGGCDYITKPFKPIELISKVKVQFALKDKEQEKIKHKKIEALTQMMFNITHYWGQPLDIISTNICTLLYDHKINTNRPEDYENILIQINDTIQFLSGTIHCFEDIIINEGNVTTFDLSQTIQNSLEKFKDKFNENNIKVISSYKEKIILNNSINVIEKSLEEILNNSIEEFINIKSETPYIFIESYIKNDDAIISIKDNANGIPQENLEKIFDPFFSTKYFYKKPGFGLYLTFQSIKHITNGNLKVRNVDYTYKSKKLRGAEFIITIPIN